MLNGCCQIVVAGLSNAPTNTETEKDERADAEAIYFCTHCSCDNSKGSLGHIIKGFGGHRSDKKGENFYL